MDGRIETSKNIHEALKQSVLPHDTLYYFFSGGVINEPKLQIGNPMEAS